MSGKLRGREIDLRAVREGAGEAARSGIPHAELLVRFADALVAHDGAGLDALRSPMIEALGAAGFLEAASVAANFQRMVRIADATGIPQDGPLLTLGGDVIEELSLRDFHSARNTPGPAPLQRLLGSLLRPVAPRLFATAAGWLARRADRRRLPD